MITQLMRIKRCQRISGQMVGSEGEVCKSKKGKPHAIKAWGPS